MGAKIAAVSSYVPKKIVTNYDLENIVDTSDEWIQSRTGIKQRRIAADDECTSTLAIETAKQLLVKGNLDPADVDLIIVATMMPDSPFPSVACKVQAAIHASNAGAFDLSAACSGFVYAMEVGAQFIKNNSARNVLVIGSEVFSRFIDWKDRSTCVLFGDGAGGVLLKSTEEKDYLLGGVLKADGTGEDLLYMPAGGTQKPASVHTVETNQHYLKMKGLELFQAVVPMVCDVIQDTCDKVGISLEDINFIIPHQANIHIIEQVSSMMQIPFDRFMINIQKFGNTSAASIPIALMDAVQDNRISSGDKIMFIGFGAGLTVAASIVEWNEDCVY